MSATLKTFLFLPKNQHASESLNIPDVYYSAAGTSPRLLTEKRPRSQLEILSEYCSVV